MESELLTALHNKPSIKQMMIYNWHSLYLSFSTYKPNHVGQVAMLLIRIHLYWDTNYPD